MLVMMQDERKVVALTLAPNEEQLLAALDDGGLWGLDLTRLSSLPVPLHKGPSCVTLPASSRGPHAADVDSEVESFPRSMP